MARHLFHARAGLSSQSRVVQKGISLLMSRMALPVIMLGLLSACVSNPSKEETGAKTRAPIAVSPEVRAEFDAAMVQMKAGDYKKGIEMMDKVVAKSQNNPVPYINLAIAHSKLGDLKAAEENLKLALNLEPDNPVANNEYGLLYRKTGRFSEARQLYEKLLEKYPYFPIVHKNLGILCDIYLRDYACALKEYEAYSEAVPDDKSAKMWVADVKNRVK